MSSSERAVEHIRTLAETFGPRPTGGTAESQAFEYTETIFQNLGLHPSRFPVMEIRPHRKVSWFGFALFTLFIAQIMVIDILPWLLPITLLLIRLVVVPYRLNQMRKPYPNGLNSFNVVAEQPAPDPKATLILGAHLDTAVASEYHQTGIHAVLRKIFNPVWGVRGLILLLLMSILRPVLHAIFGDDTAQAIVLALVWGVKGYFLLLWLYFVYRTWIRLGKPIQFAPGANDNGSGVATVLALAEYYAAHPPQHLNLRYMIFSAEEVGLIGSDRYAQALSDDDKANLFMLNFDMVATGEVVRFNRPKTHAQMNAWLLEGGAKKGSFFAFGSSDYRSFLKHKVPATGLYNTGDKMIFKVYHTTADTMAYINPVALDKVMATAKSLVQKMDAATYPLENG